MELTLDASREKLYYDRSYENSFPIANYYVQKFGVFPLVYTFGVYYDEALVDHIISLGYKKLWSSEKESKSGRKQEVSVFYYSDTLVQVEYHTNNENYERSYDFGDNALLKEVDSKEPGDTVLKMVVYYSNKETIDLLRTSFNKHKIDDSDKPKILLVTTNSRGLATIPQYINNMEGLDIGLNYGEAFEKTHNKIVERLSQDKGKGLVLLHGKPGTGKTSYIRHLCSVVHKRVIFIPPYLTENISSPQFVPFLIEHSNSILVIEDAEKIIIDRDSAESSRQGVANILNLTDGILSDCLSIQIIATFNTTREKIDKALLRKGRLIAEHKFDQLSVENSNKLLKHLQKDYITDKPMTLTEIYNFGEEEYLSQEESKSIGFNSRY